MNGNSYVISGITKLYLLFTFCMLSIFHVQAQGPGTSKQEIQKTSITYKIIEAPNNSFGYDIFAGSRLLIHQPSVPGLPGKQGFIRKADAEKIAALVIKKIENGIMPPTITLRELDSLNVKY